MLEGKVEAITIVPKAKSEVSFVLMLKKKCKNNPSRILEALDELPKNASTLSGVRKDYDAKVRI